MTRLEKKCLLASTGAHALVALLLVLAPLLWVSQHQELTLPLLTMIPSRLIDGATSGGGNPAVTTMPPPPAVSAPKTLTLPPPAEVTPPPPKPQAQAKAPELKSIKSDADIPLKTVNKRSGDLVVPDNKNSSKDLSDDSSKSKGHKVALSFERETSSRERSDTEARAARPDPAAQARAAHQRFLAGVQNALGAISRGVSSSTTIDVPGPGGEAFADYGQWVVAVYKQAWSPPRELADDLATVTAEVIIRRDGTIESFKVIKTSGHTVLDKSVERLKTVKRIEPFPVGTTDLTRRFTIDFNLHSR